MILRNCLSSCLLGSSLLLAGASHSAVITAAGSFDLFSLSVTGSGDIASVSPVSYFALGETPKMFEIADETDPVAVVLDETFSTGAATVVADAALIDPAAVTVETTAFDAGFAYGEAAYAFDYEVLDDGEVTISIDYSAFYDLDASTTADALVTLLIDDSLSGSLDMFTLLPGDPAFAFGTLSLSFPAFAGDIGSVYLTAIASVDSGLSPVPLPGALWLMVAGLAAFAGFRQAPSMA
jgi:hypothetical protein